MYYYEYWIKLVDESLFYYELYNLSKLVFFSLDIIKLWLKFLWLNFNCCLNCIICFLRNIFYVYECSECKMDDYFSLLWFFKVNIFYYVNCGVLY